MKGIQETHSISQYGGDHWKLVVAVQVNLLALTEWYPQINVDQFDKAYLTNTYITAIYRIAISNIYQCVGRA